MAAIGHTDAEPSYRWSRITYARIRGTQTVVVQVDGERVGTYAIVEGGFLPQGRRKPRTREVDARYVVLIDEATRQAQAAAKIMDSIRHVFTASEEVQIEEPDGSAEYDSWATSFTDQASE